MLNLAGNQLETVGHLTGMQALTELNLRRNRIRTVVRRMFSVSIGIILYINIYIVICLKYISISSILCELYI